MEEERTSQKSTGKFQTYLADEVLERPEHRHVQEGLAPGEEELEHLPLAPREEALQVAGEVWQEVERVDEERESLVFAAAHEERQGQRRGESGVGRDPGDLHGEHRRPPGEPEELAVEGEDYEADPNLCEVGLGSFVGHWGGE